MKIFCLSLIFGRILAVTAVFSASLFCSKLPSIPACTDSNPDICRNEARMFIGRLLFYDTALSINDKVSCASCHSQKLSFTDGIGLSTAGVTGVPLKRHSPALLNLQSVNKGLFWDGGAKNLRSLVFAPITNKDEMGLSLGLLVKKVEDRGYKKLFEKAFSDAEVSIANIALSMESFLLTMVSSNSKYDRVIRGEEKFSEQEKKGYAIFQKNCSSCHPEPDFSDHSFYNVGLDEKIIKDIEKEPDLMNLGRERISFSEKDRGKFKTPTLRNIALTAPYMHDGRFRTLVEVIEHFSSGVKKSPWTDKELLNPANRLNEEQKKELISFLETLTDREITEDRRLSSPF